MRNDQISRSGPRFHACLTRFVTVLKSNCGSVRLDAAGMPRNAARDSLLQPWHGLAVLLVAVSALHAYGAAAATLHAGQLPLRNGNGASHAKQAKISAAEGKTPLHWEAAGWGGGGFYWSAVFHPARNGVIYMGGDVAGVYKTIDHGRNWRLVNNGLASYGVFSLAVDRTNPETVYAATDGGLYKSINGGDRWQLLPCTGPKDLRITGEKGRSIRSVAVDPSNGKVVYAASPTGKVYKSENGGQTWRVAYEKQPPAGDAGTIYSVAVAAKEPSLVLAATDNSGLVLSEDAGQTWRELKTPKKASCVAVAPSDPNIIYGSFFKDGVWKSVDKGQTWASVPGHLAKGASVKEVAVSPSSPLDVYAIGNIGEWGPYVARSNDGGQTWQESTTATVDSSSGDPTLPDDLVAGTTGLSSPTNLAINPLNPKELFLSGNWRPCLSEDGGRTWTERVRRADISCVTDIRFRKGRAYVTVMDEGILVSEDDGKNWVQSWPRKWDPKFSGHYWRLAFTQIGGVDRIISTSSPWTGSPNQVVLSDDDGKTYKAATAGLPDYLPAANTMWGSSYARAMAVDPKNPSVVYLGMDGDPTPGKQGGGLFRSEDAGNTWAQLPNQPGSRRMYYGLAVDPTDSNRLYWAGCAERGGLYRSEDGGNSWQSVFTNETWPFNILVTSEGVVYCPGTNLWRSADHGRTWSQLTHFTDGSIIGLEADPRDPKTLWFSRTGWGGPANGVFRTRDSGATWREITGDLPCTQPLVLRFNSATNELWAGGATLFKMKQ